MNNVMLLHFTFEHFPLRHTKRMFTALIAHTVQYKMICTRAQLAAAACGTLRWLQTPAIDSTIIL